MEEKKAKHVNLEKKRGLFLQIGYIITLAVLLMAFEWSTEKQKTDIPVLIGDSGTIEFIDNTYREEPKERPKPKLTITDIIALIDDEADLPDDKLEFSSEIDEKTKLEVNYKFTDEPDEDNIFVVVEDMPIFRPKVNKTREEGDIDLHKYVASRITYPELARGSGIAGKVYVNFVVDKSGKVKDVHVGRSTHPLLDAEAIKVVKTIPDFRPGKQRGKNVSVSYHVVINFKLG